MADVGALSRAPVDSAHTPASANKIARTTPTAISPSGFRRVTEFRYETRSVVPLGVSAPTTLYWDAAEMRQSTS